eukprot:394590-Pyramimonas_sp.AAC.1
MVMARQCLDSPLKFFEKTEGPDNDPTWVQSLPTEALRLAMIHFLEIGREFYKQEISGALTQPHAERYNVDKFHRSVRVNK